METHVAELDRRWFKRFGAGRGAAAIRLLCFHHAGGSAAMYRQWAPLMPPSVEPIAVQLPGRADRFREPPYDRMVPLVEELVDVVKPLLDQPFALYGVSMGARVAWTLTHLLKERAMPLPRVLYVAADPAPSCDTGVWPWENRPDGLEGYVREMGGTPAEILAEPELLRALLPTLRADLSVLSTHHDKPTGPIDVRIRAFAGTEDITTSPAMMAAWQAETSAGFQLDLVPGGHFFDAAGERQVIETISRDLA